MFKRLKEFFKRPVSTPAAPIPSGREALSPEEHNRALKRATEMIGAMSPRGRFDLTQKVFEIKAPSLPKGVVPEGDTAAVAMDSLYPSASSGFANMGIQQLDFSGFPGYQYLAMLSTRAEYRQMASALATEMTREWITLSSQESDNTNSADRITELTKLLENHNIKNMIADMYFDDCAFGCGQIGVKIDKQQLHTPLLLEKLTIAKGTKVDFYRIEPMWTTPMNFNARDPMTKDFYRPQDWYMLGQHLHVSRLMRLITRPLPDILKPAFNFSGMSLFQLAEPYVNNWLRTRQSISDIINNFSITVLKTNMENLLQNTEGMITRIKLFLLNRSNNGLMVAQNGKDGAGEEVEQLNTPLSGLEGLQAQSQEHLCTVSHLPAVLLTGVSPSGLNASSDGEIRVFYDWVAAQQEAFLRFIIKYIIDILQMCYFGDIDPDITFEFEPLYQMTPKELAEIRKSDADAANIYIQQGVIAPDEQREVLAKDRKSSYSGLDLTRVIEAPDQGEEDDNQFGDKSDNEDPK